MAPQQRAKAGFHKSRSRWWEYPA